MAVPRVHHYRASATRANFVSAQRRRGETLPRRRGHRVLQLRAPILMTLSNASPSRQARDGPLEAGDDLAGEAAGEVVASDARGCALLDGGVGVHLVVQPTGLGSCRRFRMTSFAHMFVDVGAWIMLPCARCSVEGVSAAACAIASASSRGNKPSSAFAIAAALTYARP